MTRTSNKMLMKIARHNLKGNYIISLMAESLPYILSIVPLYICISLNNPAFTILGWVLFFILYPTLALGTKHFNILQAQGQCPSLYIIFKPIKDPNKILKILISNIARTVFFILWSLLFIIPGYMALFRYALTDYILAEDETIGPIDAITKSKNIMKGHKKQLFLLSLRFSPWFFLVNITFGIAAIWVIPHLQATLASFYEDQKASPHHSKYNL